LRERNILIIVLISFVLIVFLASFALGAIKVPSSNNLRVSYYRTLYRITNPQNNPERIKALHRIKSIELDNRAASRVQSARCIGCHGTMVEKDKTKIANRLMHQAMLTASFLDVNCVDCHKEVDLRGRDRKHATIKVDRKLCSKFPCHNPALMKQHGNDKKTAQEWIAKHPKVATSEGVGIKKCRECHVADSELDFCNKCHLKRGFRPQSHQAPYSAPMNQIYPTLPEIKEGKVLQYNQNPRTEQIGANWRGWHFVFVRGELEKMGVADVSAQSLPMDKIDKLSCGACHVLKVWCTKCHIKHAPNWFDPNEGHPAAVRENGSTYCEDCHDLESKCITCHTYAGQID